MEKKVIDLIKVNDIEEECIIASMDKDVLKKVKKIDQNLVRCYLIAVEDGDFYK